MTPGRVTVVIITRDRKAELLTTLAHMTTLPDRAPVVVVDNGSTDHTAHAVTERFGQVTLLCSDHNLGALGRNLAVRTIDTPYVAFCDDDTRWRPGALARAAELESATRCGQRGCAARCPAPCGAPARCCARYPGTGPAWWRSARHSLVWPGCFGNAG